MECSCSWVLIECKTSVKVLKIVLLFSMISPDSRKSGEVLIDWRLKAMIDVVSRDKFTISLELLSSISLVTSILLSAPHSLRDFIYLVSLTFSRQINCSDKVRKTIRQ